MGFKLQIKFSFLSLTHFSSRNRTYSSSSPIEQNTPDPPQQDSPVPHMPYKKTQRQTTPGPSGTQWSVDLFCSKQKANPYPFLTFYVIELTLPPFLEPSQNDETPIPDPSKAPDSQFYS
ncbi:hypothetical protein O181_025966 [Austropuccinia psidii MF-1]|uniref:Uncharacterized protein n=1 Tax=Austropuccinia psidii MF-1 TaxID=1389203 RepID=A0A9Q3H025_9BASI|nr:hypothetical protein [Austropuccinia psidii MF-1]